MTACFHVKCNEASRPGMRARGHVFAPLFAALPLIALLFGCSGGTHQANGGMSGTGISMGKITAFGSIYVNDVRWDVGSAAIELDDMAALEADLRVGMVVRVEGTLSADGTSGAATRVVFDDLVEGPIDGAPVDVDPGVTRSFVVFGLTVFIDASQTTFDGGATFAGLAANDIVEVSGFIDENGDIQASRVERDGAFQPGVSEAEIRGAISMLDTGAGTFEIGSVEIRYDSLGILTEFDGLTAGDLQDGLVVEVEGILTAVDEIDASRIERESSLLGSDDADEVELEGIVAGFTSLGADFTVAGVTVDGSMAQLEPPGLMLFNGLRVEVEGRLVAGRLIAEEIESEEDDDESAEIEAAITSIDYADGSLVALGVTVEVEAGTQLRDERDQLPNFKFSDISAGDWLEIKGGATGVDTISATEIKRDASKTDVELKGPVTALDAGVPSFSILGQPIPIDGATQYELVNGPTSESGFFSAVMLDDIVEAKDESAVSLDALTDVDEVEME